MMISTESFQEKLIALENPAQEEETTGEPLKTLIQVEEGHGNRSEWTWNVPRGLERLVVVLAILVQMVYFLLFVWQKEQYIAFSILEVGMIFLYSLPFHVLLWNRNHENYEGRSFKEEMVETAAAKPTVDVMICCYNEPVEMVEKTIMSAMEIDYPKQLLTIYLLDDGKSVKMEEMFAKLANKAQHDLSMKYIARTKLPGVPHHAKAGNINNGLKESTGDFILFLDCDMVVKPEILDRLMPYFFDEQTNLKRSVAMVQSPQSFENITALDDPLDQTYAFLYEAFRTWDKLGATPCNGTNVVFSREILCSIGGIQYGSITEDFMTSMELQSRGFQTKFVPEALGVGVAPESISVYFTQRFRWTAGVLEIFWKTNPMLKTGLSVYQKMFYFWYGVNALLSLGTLTILGCFLFGLFVPTHFGVEISEPLLLVVFVHLLQLGVLFRNVSVNAVKHHLQEIVYATFCNVQAVISTLLPGNMAFTVTDKDNKSKIVQDLICILPHLVVVVVSLLAIGFSHERLEALLGAMFLLVAMWPPIYVFLRKNLF